MKFSRFLAFLPVDGIGNVVSNRCFFLLGLKVYFKDKPQLLLDRLLKILGMLENKDTTEHNIKLLYITLVLEEIKTGCLFVRNITILRFANLAMVLDSCICQLCRLPRKSREASGENYSFQVLRQAVFE